MPVLLKRFPHALRRLLGPAVCACKSPPPACALGVLRTGGRNTTHICCQGRPLTTARTVDRPPRRAPPHHSPRKTCSVSQRSLQYTTHASLTTYTAASTPLRIHSPCTQSPCSSVSDPYLSGPYLWGTGWQRKAQTPQARSHHRHPRPGATAVGEALASHAPAPAPEFCAGKDLHVRHDQT